MVTIPPIKMVMTGRWFIVLPTLFFDGWGYTNLWTYERHHLAARGFWGSSAMAWNQWNLSEKWNATGMICSGWDLPLWKMMEWVTVGIMKFPYIMENFKKCSKPPTSFCFKYIILTPKSCDSGCAQKNTWIDSLKTSSKWLQIGHGWILWIPNCFENSTWHGQPRGSPATWGSAFREYLCLILFVYGFVWK